MALEAGLVSGPSRGGASSFLPNVGDILFILILQLMLGLLPNFVYGDGSTGWHLVTGKYILEHGLVPRTDLISHSFADKSWVAYEWLFDAIIALFDQIGGLKLVAVLSVSAIAYLFLLIYEDCRKAGGHFFLCLILCVLGALLSAIHWLVRPHLVTFFGVYLFSKMLERYQSREISAIRLCSYLGLFMLFWVNCHPAFLMGLAIIFIYLGGNFPAAFLSGEGPSKKFAQDCIKVFSLAFALCLLISFVNPYGANLYSYIFEYLHQTAVIGQTDEYASPTFHGALQPTCLEFLFFALAIGLVASREKPRLPRLLLVLAYCHLALASVRNLPLFVIVCLPFIAWLMGRMDLGPLVPSASAANYLQPLLNYWRHLGSVFDQTEFSCNKHLLPVIAVVVLSFIAISGGSLGPLKILSSDFDPKTKPTETLNCLVKEKLDPKRGFNLDNWGGYLRYKTGERVFIDDRVDFYGQKFYLDYAEIATLQPHWRETLDKYKIEWVLFPNNSLLTGALRKEKGWRLLCSDQAASLFIRDPS